MGKWGRGDEKDDGSSGSSTRTHGDHSGCDSIKTYDPTATVAPDVQVIPPEPANPVPILKKIKGCVLEEGTEVGSHTLNGERFASCGFMDNVATDANGKPLPGTVGTSVTVFTYPGDPRQLETAPQSLKSDDMNKKIIGKDFVVTLTGMWDSYGYSKHLGRKELEEMARQVGGEYIPSQ